jgi:hypothetical protein
MSTPLNSGVNSSMVGPSNGYSRCIHAASAWVLPLPLPLPLPLLFLLLMGFLALEEE